MKTNKFFTPTQLILGAIGVQVLFLLISHYEFNDWKETTDSEPSHKPLLQEAQQKARTNETVLNNSHVTTAPTLSQKSHFSNESNLRASEHPIMTIAEFDQLGKDTLNSIPTIHELQALSVAEVHHIKSIIRLNWPSENAALPDA